MTRHTDHPERPSRNRRRGPLMLLGAVAATAFLLLAVSGLQGSVTYYVTPTEMVSDPPSGEVRLGGMVAVGSVRHHGDRLHFTVTDGATDVDVVASSVPPDTFREGQGAVLEGRMEGGVFDADQIIVRHSNEYRAPDDAGPAP